MVFILKVQNIATYGYFSAKDILVHLENYLQCGTSLDQKLWLKYDGIRRSQPPKNSITSCLTLWSSAAHLSAASSPSLRREPCVLHRNRHTHTGARETGPAKRASARTAKRKLQKKRGEGSTWCRRRPVKMLGNRNRFAVQQREKRSARHCVPAASRLYNVRPLCSVFLCMLSCALCGLVSSLLCSLRKGCFCVSMSECGQRRRQRRRRLRCGAMLLTRRTTCF